MAGSISGANDGFYQLAQDLGHVPLNSGRKLRQAIEVTSRSIKDEWNGDLYSDGHAKLTGHSITYEVHDAADLTGSSLTSDIGAVKGSGRQAGVVLLLEYGSIHNPPHGAGAAALQNNQADFDAGVQKAVDDALKESGL